MRNKSKLLCFPVAKSKYLSYCHVAAGLLLQPQESGDHWRQIQLHLHAGKSVSALYVRTLNFVITQPNVELIIFCWKMSPFKNVISRRTLVLIRVMCATPGWWITSSARRRSMSSSTSLQKRTLVSRSWN